MAVVNLFGHFIMVDVILIGYVVIAFVLVMQRKNVHFFFKFVIMAAVFFIGYSIIWKFPSEFMKY